MSFSTNKLKESSILKDLASGVGIFTIFSTSLTTSTIFYSVTLTILGNKMNFSNSAKNFSIVSILARTVSLEVALIDLNSLNKIFN